MGNPQTRSGGTPPELCYFLIRLFCIDNPNDSTFTGAGRMNRSPVSRLAVPCLAVLFLLCFPRISNAQSASSRAVITGAVTDQQGGAVPGASVTVRSAD